MHALADWIAKLVQILCCIKIDICIMCSIVDQVVDLYLYILVHLFVQSSGHLSLSGGGGLQNPAIALDIIVCVTTDRVQGPLHTRIIYAIMYK